MQKLWFRKRTGRTARLYANSGECCREKRDAKLPWENQAFLRKTMLTKQDELTITRATGIRASSCIPAPPLMTPNDYIVPT